MLKAVLTNGLIGGLQVVEHALKREWDALRWMLIFCRDLVHGLRDVSKYICGRENNKLYLSEVVGAEERL